jgi:hypothetical protein
MKAPSVKPVRCAIYTRVSTEQEDLGDPHGPVTGKILVDQMGYECTGEAHH